MAPSFRRLFNGGKLRQHSLYELTLTQVVQINLADHELLRQRCASFKQFSWLRKCWTQTDVSTGIMRRRTGVVGRFKVRFRAPKKR